MLNSRDASLPVETVQPICNTVRDCTETLRCCCTSVVVLCPPQRGKKCLHTCYVVDAVLPRVELVLAETAVAGELGLGAHNARLLVLVAVHIRMDVPEMLLCVSCDCLKLQMLGGYPGRFV